MFLGYFKLLASTNSASLFSRQQYGSFQISGGKLCTTCFWAEIWKISCLGHENMHPMFPGEMRRISYFRQETLWPENLGWTAEKFTFQAGNSVPQVSRLKGREFHISGRKLSTPSFQAEMLKVSYFRQETMCPNFPGWNVENFIIQSGNPVPRVSRLKYGEFHYSGR